MGENNYYVCREAGYVYNTVTKEIIARPPKIMFWGSICYNFKKRLMFFTTNVNSDAYVIAIKKNGLKK